MDDCIKGTTGVVCELCSKGYGKQLGAFMECSTSSIAILSVAIFFTLVVWFLIVYLIRKKMKKNRKYLAAWKEIIAVLKVNSDFMQISCALPSVLAIPLLENFVGFLKAFDFINVDFLSMTGATCAGATFMVRFAAMSVLPLVGILIGIFQYLHPPKKKLKDVANEMFLMMDEDHSGTIDSSEYNDLVQNLDGTTTTKSFNKQEFFNQSKTLDQEKLMKWWNDQSRFSHALNTTVQILLLVHTPVTRMVFQYFNCHPIHSKSFIKVDYSIECWVGS